MRIPRNLVGAAAAIAGVLAFAAPASASPAEPPAPAAESPAAAPAFWDTACHYGRACIHLAGNNYWWNLEHCGWNNVNDHYSWAQAHGNGFTVWYGNNTWDFVHPWTNRPLDGKNWVKSVHVDC